MPRRRTSSSRCSIQTDSVSRAQCSTKCNEVVRCRPGIVTNAALVTIPDQRRTTACCAASGKRVRVSARWVSRRTVCPRERAPRRTRDRRQRLCAGPRNLPPRLSALRLPYVRRPFVGSCTSLAGLGCESKTRRERGIACLLTVILRCSRPARASKDAGRGVTGRRPSRLASLAPQGDGIGLR